MEAGESIVPSCGIVGEDTRRTPELDLAGSETVVEPLLLTADTGGLSHSNHPKHSFTDMTAGQSDLGSPSAETPSDDSRL